MLQHDNVSKFSENSDTALHWAFKSELTDTDAVMRPAKRKLFLIILNKFNHKSKYNFFCHFTNNYDLYQLKIHSYFILTLINFNKRILNLQILLFQNQTINIVHIVVKFNISESYF